MSGNFPFYEAATIGGGGTTRYLDPQRYAALSATSELRIPFGRGDASPVVTFTSTSEPGHAGLRIRLGLNF